MSTRRPSVGGADRTEELRVIRSPQHGPASSPGMLQVEDLPQRPRSPRQSMELIIAPPPLVIRSPQYDPASSSMPGTHTHNTSNSYTIPGTDGHARTETHLEVVLHDPATQRVVIWDGSQRNAQVQSTVTTPSCCPFCHQQLPVREAAAAFQHTPFRSERYFSLLAAQQQFLHPEARETDDEHEDSAYHFAPVLPALPPIEGGAARVADASARHSAHLRIQDCDQDSPSLAVGAGRVSMTRSARSAAAQAAATNRAASNDPRPSERTPQRADAVLPDVTVTSSTPSGDASSSNDLPPESMSPGYYKCFFRPVRRIGTGAYGSVWEARHTMDGVTLGTYAVKIAPVGDNRAWLRKNLREVFNLQALKHSNVVQYLHCWLEPHQNSPFAPRVPCLFILMEYANGGNLETYLGLDEPKKKRALLSDEEVVSAATDMAKGLQYLHSLGIVHRDLKPANIIIHVNEDTEVGRAGRARMIISDLGQSQRLSENRGASKRSGTTGTVRFCSPEMLDEMFPDGVCDAGTFSPHRRYVNDWSTKADVWSLGAIFFCLCFSELPFEEIEDLQELAEAISGARSVPRPSKPARPPSFLLLLDATLQSDPGLRPDVSVILSMPLNTSHVIAAVEAGSSFSSPNPPDEQAATGSARGSPEGGGRGVG
ncbi:kinase-like domain-containing protein, partial [Baffinella frigidus]